jgi:hypothetical protein
LKLVAFILKCSNEFGGRRDRLVVVYTTAYTISAYHHWRCGFEYRSGEVYSIQHNVIKFVSDLRQVGGILRGFRYPPPIKLTTMTEILLKVTLNTKILNTNPTNLLVFITSKIGEVHKIPTLQTFNFNFISDFNG